MNQDDLGSYIRATSADSGRLAKGIKDFSVFDLQYIPDKPLFREEAKTIIDRLMRYKHTRIPRNMCVVGSRGSGKTLLLSFLARVFPSECEIPFLVANCRVHNTSFKVLAHFLNVNARGYGLSELWGEFEKKVPRGTVIVLDEVDILAEHDLRRDILYFLSRSPNSYCVVLLSNSPKFIDTLDESTKSSLQPERIYFKNYSAQEIHEILRQRAKAGMESADDAILGEIAALTARNTNSDVRVAIKTLLYHATKEAESVSECFERARRDLVLDLLHNLNDKALLILSALMKEPDGFVKDIYRRYVDLSRTQGEEAYSYMHFYNNLSYLQSVGLVLLILAKVNRAYTKRIEPLFSVEQLETVLRARFA
jgi:archaeal cell division control protein 6